MLFTFKPSKPLDSFLDSSFDSEHFAYSQLNQWPTKSPYAARAPVRQGGGGGRSWRARLVWASGVRAEGLTSAAAQGPAREAAERVTVRVGRKLVWLVWGRAREHDEAEACRGVVETVTSAQWMWGQLLVGGKGKQNKRKTGEVNGAALLTECMGGPKN